MRATRESRQRRDRDGADRNANWRRASRTVWDSDGWSKHATQLCVLGEYVQSNIEERRAACVELR
jgi:hypothetical protein